MNAVVLDGNELFAACGNSGVKCIATNGRGLMDNLPTSCAANCVNPNPNNAATPGRSLRSLPHTSTNTIGHKKTNAAVTTMTTGVNQACETANACKVTVGPSTKVGIT
jgi:hypothetical protein